MHPFSKSNFCSDSKQKIIVLTFVSFNQIVLFFQTHIIGGSCIFIDGPGLVIPNLAMNRASMVLGGILSIDTLTEYGSVMDLVMQKVPFAHLLSHYGVMKDRVLDAKRSDRQMGETMLFLSSLGLMRGFVKGGGMPDHARGARMVLKDFVEGKLVFCQAPPNVDQASFCHYKTDVHDDIKAANDLDLEESFPELKLGAGVHMRGRRHVAINGLQKDVFLSNKKHEKKRREKVRRIYGSGESPYGESY